MMGMKDQNFLLSLLMNLGIFQWEEEVFFSLFFIHWPGVFEDPPRKERNREKRETEREILPLIPVFIWC